MSGYDAIVVGARCAGSPVAMLLARKGYRVLLVDRATFPSDTLSTHVVQPPAVSALKRWGLLDRLIASGCPPIHTYTFDFGPLTLAGRPGTPDSPVAYAPRRLVLDKILVDAAVEAGAELREGFVVDEIVTEDERVVGIRGRTRHGDPITERASVVIGADGRHSIVAESVQAPTYNERPALLAPYYTYWSNLTVEGRFDAYIRPNRGYAAAPTHDGLTVLVVAWPHAEFAENKQDIEASYFRALELVPELFERVRAAKREARWLGMPTPNLFRKPFGPGWALVGDAGYLKDPITAQGIRDAFRDAEACVRALDEHLSGARPFEAALADYQASRDESALAMYDFTCQMATLRPPSSDMQQLIARIRDTQAAMDGFAQMNAGTISPAQFFSADNIRSIVGG